MKVLQINTVYGQGSTGNIVKNLESIMKEEQIEAYVAYGRGAISTSEKHYRVGDKFDFICHVLYQFITGKNGLASTWKTHKLIKWIEGINPDVIHLHNIHGFYLNYSVFFDYLKAKNYPVIWTFHDCWSFTGHCAYFDLVGCEKWKEQCDSCPVYQSDYPYGLLRDSSEENYQMKKTSFTGLQNLMIVSPSRWLVGLVKQSFLQSYPVEVIVNGIRQDIFTMGKALEDRSKAILAVANVWDKRKGLHDVLQLSKRVPDGYQMIIIGLNKKQKSQIDKMCCQNITAICKVSSVQIMAEYYRNARVFINPTYEDNFPTTNLEALASGTPVITYATGGSGECIGENCGRIVPKGDVEAMANAIVEIVESKTITNLSCKAQALQYDSKEQLRKYIDVYARYQ